MRLITKQKILDYMQHRDWTSCGQLESMASGWFTTGSTIAKRCRELEEVGSMEKRYINHNGVRTVQYRLKRQDWSVQEAETFLDTLRQQEKAQEILL